MARCLAGIDAPGIVLYNKAVQIANALHRSLAPAYWAPAGWFDLLLFNLYIPWVRHPAPDAKPGVCSCGIGRGSIYQRFVSKPEDASSNMIVVADNLHVMQPAFARAIERMDPEPVREMVLDCLRCGAEALDINPGPLSKRPEERMAFLVETVQATTDLPLVLDTVNPAAMTAGLKACRGRCIINGFSLEPAKLQRILPLAREYGADIIGYLLHPNSQVPIDAAEMMEVAIALFGAYTDAGLDPARLIIDPVVAPLTWQDGARHNRAVLNVVGTLVDLLGVPVRTIAGISNLASGPVSVARKIELECAFLPMLAAAGLDMALTNVRHAATVGTAKICHGLLGDQVFALTPQDASPDGA